MKPEISVLLCTYNSEDFLDPCLKSILSQTFKEFEVICIDGGSQDNTLEKIKKYMSKDSRVKLIINKKRFPEGKGFGKSLGF
jgi:glycosyltransferase involved in cell wall biosynthesis